MSVNLLATKLHRPTPSAKRVQRAHLIQRLNEGLLAGRQLTLVSAPAGFGKTTCVSEWVGGLDLPVTWLSLDPMDDDPGRFFTYLCAALQKIDPHIGREIEGLLRAGQLPPAEIISTTLINDLLACPNQFVLVLDDVHLVRERFILQVLERLVANLPPALHLVLLTREDPALPLARLRANDQMTEIRAAELRFTPAEAGSFLNESMGLCLSGADIAILDERTEGWIVGLQLAGLSVRDRPDPSHFIATLSGSHRYILNYLTEEVLSRQTEDVREFLLQTSILERLNGDLCDALTDGSGSQALLERFCGANLFLVALDDEQHWYRYHHLFADLLRDRLNKAHKGELARLHQRASRWYAQAGEGSFRPDERAAFISAAVKHALSAADYETAVRLIETSAMSMIMQWYAKTVNGWVQALPPEWRAKSPRTNLAFAWNHLLHGDFPKAAPHLDQLGAIFASFQAGDDPSLQAEWLALQAWLQNVQGKPADGLALASRALESVPEADVTTRSLIYMALAGAYSQLDDYAHSVESYQNLIRYGQTAGNITTELLGISALGQIALFHGQYRFTFEIASQGIERMERSGSIIPISTAIYGELAEIHYQWNQLEQAQKAIRRAIQVSTLSGYSHAAIYYNVLLSRLSQRAGNLEAAEQQIDETIAWMRTELHGFLKEEAVSQQVRILLAQDRLADAEAAFSYLWAESSGQPFSSQVPFIFPEVLPDQAASYPGGRLYNIALRLCLYRSRGERNQAGLARGIRLADDLFSRMLQSGYLPIALETLLLRSQLKTAAGDPEAGQGDMIQALELGEREGLISLFVEEGQPVGDALQILVAQRRLSGTQTSYIRSILAAFPGASLPGKTSAEPASLIEPLTERERDVLRLIAEGLKYEEIAGRLFISLNTVRTYVKGIYGKLDVNSRSQAVLAARQHQIL